MVLYHAGDMAGAISQQHKELIINERCLGLDHPDTAHRYSVFYCSWFIIIILGFYYILHPYMSLFIHKAKLDVSTGKKIVILCCRKCGFFYKTACSRTRTL